MLELGKVTKVKVLGKDWTVSRLELRVIDAWREYLVECVGDPFADCDRPWFDKLPDAEKVARIKAAEKVADQLKAHKFTINCEVSQQAMQTEKGAARFGRLMLEEHHPEIDDDTAFQVWLAIGPELDKVMRRAQGRVPGGNGAAPATPGDAAGLSLIGGSSTSS